jgi:thiamine transporter
MVPIFLMAYRWGIKGGMLTGLLLGLLQIVSGTAWISTPIQAFIDYYLAFTVVGISGVFMNKFVNSYKEEKRSKAKWFGICGMFLGSFLRFLCHFVSGIVFFGSAAPKGQPVAIYSFIYNGTYMLISFILSALVVMMLYSAASSVLLKKAY